MSITQRYMDDDDALEVANDGFLKIFNSIQKFTFQGADPRAQLTAWVKKIMVNACIDRIRSNKQLFYETYSRGNEVLSENAENLIVAKFSNTDLLKMVSKLPPSYRAVFNLYVVDGYSHEEISKYLNISVGTSKSNLSKARESLKKMLADAGIVYYGQKAS